MACSAASAASTARAATSAARSRIDIAASRSRARRSCSSTAAAPPPPRGWRRPVRRGQQRRRRVARAALDLPVGGRSRPSLLMRTVEQPRKRPVITAPRPGNRRGRRPGPRFSWYPARPSAAALASAASIPHYAIAAPCVALAVPDGSRARVRRAEQSTRASTAASTWICPITSAAAPTASSAGTSRSAIFLGARPKAGQGLRSGPGQWQHLAQGLAGTPWHPSRWVGWRPSLRGRPMKLHTSPHRRARDPLAASSRWPRSPSVRRGLPHAPRAARLPDPRVDRPRAPEPPSMTHALPPLEHGAFPIEASSASTAEQLRAQSHAVVRRQISCPLHTLEDRRLHPAEGEHVYERLPSTPCRSRWGCWSGPWSRHPRRRP